VPKNRKQAPRGWKEVEEEAAVKETGDGEKEHEEEEEAM